MLRRKRSTYCLLPTRRTARTTDPQMMVKSPPIPTPMRLSPVSTGGRGPNKKYEEENCCPNNGNRIQQYERASVVVEAMMGRDNGLLDLYRVVQIMEIQRKKQWQLVLCNMGVL
ncbi:hypothetical protein AVEN_74316-1 [Araneus ventricosus]|uniref:Uncharacterized protein n=1 Tax=Araneus ventricosus TaxID=182803 RepID=A0A4Y2HMY8_ARAVE|nr:hypothetical protein AVEN_74316-1 [Araneus ventricosus]